MVKGLRRKLMVSAMSAVALVLIVIIGAINAINYYKINQNADRRLELLARNDGVFPGLQQHDDRPPMHGEDFSPEAPFETRYFSVTLNQKGGVLSVDTGRIAAVDTVSAKEMAEELFAAGKTSGFYGDYKYCARSDDDKIMYLFLDCARDLETFRSFLRSSVWISLAALVLVCLLIFLFSGAVLAPVVRSYEKQKRFITDASHELKTPLTVIETNAEVIEMTAGESEWTKSIRAQVSRLTSLVEKLVTLCRMEEENGMRESEFSLSEAVRDAAEPFGAVAEGAGKQLKTKIEDGVLFRGDQQAIRRMVDLLLDNAVKYASDAGTVTLSLKSAGKRRILTVSNPAEGFAPGEHKELFERFWRPDDSRSTKTGGFGIGLSTVQAIVNAHRGKVTARADTNGMICFTVTL